MSDEHDHEHEHEHEHAHHEHDYDYDHNHDEHDHDHDHDHDHALIVDRLPPGRWQVDPHGSDVLFKARSLFGLLPVSGVFEHFSGVMDVDPEGAATGQLVVETPSI